MLKQLLFGLSVASLAALTILANNASAISISIPNFSFENPDLGASGAVATIDDWTDPSGCCDGVFVSPGYGQDAAPTDGDQIAFLNVDVGQIFQTLSTDYQANTDYTIQLDISARTGPAATDILVALYHGTISGVGDLNASNTVASTVLDGTDGVVADTFNTFSLSATAAEVSAVSGVGQPIGLGFFGNGGGTSGNSDFDLDNIRLDGTLIPEPSTFALAGLGLLGLLGFTRRGRR